MACPFREGEGGFSMVVLAVQRRGGAMIKVERRASRAERVSGDFVLA